MSDVPTSGLEKCKFTNILHDKLMQINSHNVSCLFKATLSQHATKGLLDCEDEYDGFYCYSDQEPEARYADYKAPAEPGNEEGETEEDTACSVDNNNNKSGHTHHGRELSGTAELELSIEMLRSQLYNINIHSGKDDGSVGEAGSRGTTEDGTDTPPVTLTHFYNTIRIGPEERFPKNHICGWRVCRSGHLADLDPMLLQYHAENDIFSESTRRLMSVRGRQPCAVHTVSSGERVPYGIHPYILQPTNPGALIDLKSDRTCLESKYERNANQNAKSPSKTSSKAKVPVPKLRLQKTRSKSAKSKTSGLLEKTSMQNLVESPIAYHFHHNPGYRAGYIQQYREQYTVKKLQHILLQCAERYYASKQQQPVAKAAVQCTDVREGACLVSDGGPRIPIKKRSQSKSFPGQKPLGFIRKKPSPLKVSQYRFDLAQNLRTQAKHAKSKYQQQQYQHDKARPKSSSVESSPCVTPVERKKADSPGPFSLALSGVPKYRKNRLQTSLQDLPVFTDVVMDDAEEQPAEAGEALICEGADKQSELEQAKTILTKILRGGSPIVSRSRPTIPSNSRGIVYATSVETPMHIVTGTKPLLRAIRCVWSRT